MAKHRTTLIDRIAQATALISHARPGSEADLQAKARAAIREVAAWLDTKGQHGSSFWLREELQQPTGQED